MRGYEASSLKVIYGFCLFEHTIHVESIVLSITVDKTHLLDKFV